MQQAEDRYQAGQLPEAIALWQQAATLYDHQGDSLNHALVHSFLAAAFEDLGQWAQATAAIDQALSLVQAESASSVDRSLALAQVLTTQGKLQLAQGKAVEAVETWQQAEAAYRKANDSSGIVGSQINQARALQAAGLYRRATILLTQAETSLQNQPDPRLKVTGLRNLGKILRLVGNLKQSRIVLEQSLAILQDGTPQSAADIAGILLSLGNTTRAQGETDSALTFYQQAAATAPSLTAKTQVQLVQLSLLLEADRPTEAQRLLPDIQSQLAKLPPGRLAAYARINLSQSLIKLRIKQSKTLSTPPSPPLTTTANLLATAIQQVRAIGDRRTESYALGTLGNLYETTQQWGQR
jgi:tetratricopeptide (TPR) repeat protein